MDPEGDPMNRIASMNDNSNYVAWYCNAVHREKGGGGVTTYHLFTTRPHSNLLQWRPLRILVEQQSPMPLF